MLCYYLRWFIYFTSPGCQPSTLWTKIAIFPCKYHLANLVKCMESDVSQQGADCDGDDELSNWGQIPPNSSLRTVKLGLCLCPFSARGGNYNVLNDSIASDWKESLCIASKVGSQIWRLILLAQAQYFHASSSEFIMVCCNTGSMPIIIYII